MSQLDTDTQLQTIAGWGRYPQAVAELRVSEESTAVEWHRVDSLPEPLSPAARLRIGDGLAGQVAAFIR